MNITQTPIYHQMFSHLTNSLHLDVMKIAEGEIKLHFNYICESDLISLCYSVGELFKNEDTLLELTGRFIIVGDLHGHILDLFRILHKFGIPPRVNYLFLGDLVDRGEFSRETCSIIFLLKILFPKNVYVIRGNHESEQFACTGGLSAEISPFGPTYLAFQYAFSYLPLAALIDRQTLCVHGGIGPSVSSLQQIRLIRRPILDFSKEDVASLLWNDPDTSIDNYETSPRGIGYVFGQKAFELFIRTNNLLRIIRAHEVVETGAQELFNSQLITVFSASNYCGAIKNQSAVLCYDSNSIDIIRFQPIPYIRRHEATFESPSVKEPIAPPASPRRSYSKTPRSPVQHRRSVQPSASLSNIKIFSPNGKRHSLYHSASTVSIRLGSSRSDY